MVYQTPDKPNPSPYKIERGIPVPDKAWTSDRARYPFGHMLPGDSVLIHDRPLCSVASAVKSAKAHRPGWDFTVRQIGGSIRVWRTA